MPPKAFRHFRVQCVQSRKYILVIEKKSDNIVYVYNNFKKDAAHNHIEQRLNFNAAAKLFCGGELIFTAD